MNSFLLGDRLDVTRGVKVLVVDSDPKNVQALGAALRDRGCESLDATSFEAAKKLWVAEKPPMLIADVRLGQFNGLQLLLRAKADRPDVRALITCAVADKVLEAETQRFGGMFLVKPLKPEEVMEMFLGPRRPATPEPTVERRQAERRSAVEGSVLPDRRLSERRIHKRD